MGFRDSLSIAVVFRRTRFRGIVCSLPGKYAYWMGCIKPLFPYSANEYVR